MQGIVLHSGGGGGGSGSGSGGQKTCGMRERERGGRGGREGGIPSDNK